MFKQIKLFKTAVAGASLVALVSACGTETAMQSETQNTAKGAGLGAVGGAVIGSIIAGDDDRGKGAVIGGLAGAALGGVIGNQLDKQAQELQQAMAPSGVIVERRDDRINLVVPGDVTFQTNSSNIDLNSYGTLDQLSRSLMAYPNSKVYVIGHTDNVGSYDYNLQLSQLRANSVATYLANTGIAMERLYTIGKSFTEPKASNATLQGQAQNRRVEIQIIPTG